MSNNVIIPDSNNPVFGMGNENVNGMAPMGASANFGGALAMSASENNALAMATQQKAIVEARYMMAMARPRDLDVVRQKLLKDAKRSSFARVALYHKPVGKTGIEGPSIRFVEAALRAMTNILTETMTIAEDENRRVVRVACSDLETNTYYSQDVTITKTVERSSCPQGEKPLRIRTNSFGKPVYVLRATDDDILNKQNALISKAVRTIGLRLIPGDIMDEAEFWVKDTLKKDAFQNPDQVKNNIIDSFGKIGVQVDGLKEYLGHDLSTASPAELNTLRMIYKTIDDGETTWNAVLNNKRELDALENAERKKKSTSAKKDDAAETTTSATAANAPKAEEANK